MSNADYRERHNQFLQRLDNSRPAMFRAAEWLHKKGLGVILPAIRYRPLHSAPDQFVDSGDIFIEKGDKTYRVEVKHSGQDFTDAKSWPFKTMFVSNKAAVERGSDVFAYIILNKPMTHLAIIRKETSAYWELVEKFASNTQKKEFFYTCPLNLIEFKSINDD